jgi:hypothetical protein
MTEATTRKRALAGRLAKLSLPAMTAPPGVGSELLRELLGAFAERRNGVAIDVYVERLSVDELSELVRFFESDVGQSFVQTFPIFEERMRALIQTLGTERMSDEQGGRLGSLSSVDLAKLMEHAKQPPSK